jgi:Family of unknown function (DUF6152)
VSKFQKKFGSAIAAIALLTIATTASAHHAVNAQFDVTKNVLLTGVLTKVEIINPHSYIHFDVKDVKGKVTNYSIETGAPGALKRAGLSMRDALKVGETYKFVICPSRNGTPTGLMSGITLPDGKSFTFGAQTNIDAAKDLNEGK